MKQATEEELGNVAELYRVFGDKTRVTILHALMDTEMCVNDLAAALNMTDSAISHQMRILKQTHLVRNRKDGKMVYYSLADDHVRTILGQGLEHVRE